MLKGKTAIVTGGSRGIGKAIALRLASLGADIAVIYAGNTDKAESVCRQCREEYGVKAAAYQCNVSDFLAVKEAIAKIKGEFGTAHILVNNAGITRDGLLAMMREEDYDAVMDTNLKGAFNMIRHCAGLFIRNREGCIINITSVAGIMGNAGQCNYAASKAGLIGLTKSYRHGYDGRPGGQSAAGAGSAGADGGRGGCGRSGGLPGSGEICDGRNPPGGRRNRHVRRKKNE